MRTLIWVAVDTSGQYKVSKYNNLHTGDTYINIYPQWAFMPRLSEVEFSRYLHPSRDIPDFFEVREVAIVIPFQIPVKYNMRERTHFPSYMAKIKPTEEKKNTIRLPRTVREENLRTQLKLANVVSYHSISFKIYLLCEKKIRKYLI